MLCRWTLRFPNRTTAFLSLSLRLGARTMSTAEALNTEIARQTSILNEPRLQNTDTAAIDAAHKKLSELKRSKVNIPKSIHADADGTSATLNKSKRERLLLKTAKVGRTVLH